VDRKGAGFSQIDCKKAIGKGLRFRTADEVARDTLAWWKTLPEERRAKLRAGLSPDREKEVLAAWKARNRETLAVCSQIQDRSARNGCDSPRGESGCPAVASVP